jgi:isoleucyl-tRNA synthetase
VYQGLTEERSVHLADWPALDELPADPQLVRAMELVREVCSAGHAIRKESGRRLRLPLSRLTFAGPRALELADYLDLIAEEVNVKEVVLTAETSVIAEEVMTIVPSVIGPRLGADTQKVIAAVKRGEWTLKDDGTVEAAGITVAVGEYSLVLRPRDEHSARALGDGAGVVRLDLETTAELENEGLARDLVRLVQAHRRDEGLHISDRVHLVLALPEDMALAAQEHRDWIMEQTLATEMQVTAGEPTEPVSIELTVSAPG